jgi:hypothetical protein
LMAVLTGKTAPVTPIVSAQPAAIVFFTSDNVTETAGGFSIQYKALEEIETCLHQCSGHGACTAAGCECALGYYGLDCASTLCRGAVYLTAAADSGVITDNVADTNYANFQVGWLICCNVGCLCLFTICTLVHTLCMLAA